MVLACYYRAWLVQRAHFRLRKTRSQIDFGTRIRKGAVLVKMAEGMVADFKTVTYCPEVEEAIQEVPDITLYLRKLSVKQYLGYLQKALGSAGWCVWDV